MRREDVTFMAASIAYHALVSMLPLLFLLVLVVSTFGSAELVDTALGLTRSFPPTTGRRIVIDALRNATDDTGLSVIGIAVGAVLFGTVVRIPPTVPFAGSLADLVGALALAVAFLPIFSVFPDTGVSLREAAPGVVVAALGWAALEWLFHRYVAFTNKPDIYGLVGTLLLVTWLYAGSLVLLVGASVNATLAGRDGKREAERRSRRTFGRRVTDAGSFADRLDDVVHRADSAGVSAEEIRRTLRQRADDVETPAEAEEDAEDSTVGEPAASAETDGSRE
nr:YihY/virulence factor BrkB family protein [Halorussus sp. JP-T4]